jgi:hypothetical protein
MLESVSFYTAEDAVSYVVRIYDRFEGGELLDELAVKTGVIDYLGFHTVDLDDPVSLSEGNDFYVYLQLSHGGQAFDRTSDVPVLLGGDARPLVESRADPGQSYWRNGAAWDDLTDFNETANFCIKGLATAQGLHVTPEDHLRSDGPEGGPFSPPSQTFDFILRGASPADFQVSLDPPVDWLTLSGDLSGTLNPYEGGQVTAEINSNAEILSEGAFVTYVQFTNSSTHLGDTSRRIALCVGSPSSQHQWALDIDPGWDTDGDWAFGQPTGQGGSHGPPDPTSGYTGDNVYGYNLDGDYPPGIGQMHLTSRAIDCTDLFKVQLKFQRWLGVQHGGFDHVYVWASGDSVRWIKIWENERRIVDGEWVPIEYDISEVADGESTVYLRWTMGSTDGSWEYCGWNIDDIEVWALPRMNLTGIEESEEIASRATLRLDPVHPNPFNPTTTVRFHLPKTSGINLSVFDVSGRRVTILAEGRIEAGTHSLTWDGRDERGVEVGPGVYFLRLEADRRAVSRKMVLVK